MRELLWPGLELMLVGMGVVFVFLVLLVFVTSLMSRLVNQFHRPQAEPARPATMAAAASDVSPQTLAVIRAAIQQHRDRQKRSS